MANDKTLLTKPIKGEPIRRGIYKDIENDLSGYTLTISNNTDSEQQLVFGWANVSITAEGDIPLDYQGDIILPEILENAAYNYVLNFGTAGQMHWDGTECGYLVESAMFTKEKMVAMGIPEGVVPEGWWVGFYIPDPLVFKMVKDGIYNMFSIQGSARKLVL